MEFEEQAKNLFQVWAKQSVLYPCSWDRLDAGAKLGWIAVAKKVEQDKIDLIKKRSLPCILG